MNSLSAISAQVRTPVGGQSSENQRAELQQVAASKGSQTPGERAALLCATRSERARVALASIRQHGTRSGKPIGRPRAVINLDQIIELRQQGVSWRKIARRTGAGVGTVRRAYQGHRDAAEVSECGPAPKERYQRIQTRLTGR